MTLLDDKVLHHVRVVNVVYAEAKDKQLHQIVIEHVPDGSESNVNCRDIQHVNVLSPGALFRVLFPKGLG